ncbi:hypothetical protein C5167_045508 [Papaver somniferum]|uniref:Uncharacterized protein n=1 Tax=Papaver somniferum TaxID=3469 RepID=A0A4Y7LEK3_PAPSO|nr:hypothetical protein C5167_045508 [Papaver somniferum]
MTKNHKQQMLEKCRTTYEMRRVVEQLQHQDVHTAEASERERESRLPIPDLDKALHGLLLEHISCSLRYYRYLPDTIDVAKMTTGIYRLRIFTNGLFQFRYFDSLGSLLLGMQTASMAS